MAFQRRQRSTKVLILALGPLAAFCLLPSAYCRAGAPPAVVTVHTDQPAGRIRPESVMNLSTDAVHGQFTQPLADPAMAWLRATNALSYVRCYNWLGDGIPKDRPEWFSGCRIARSGPGGTLAYEWEPLERVLDTLVASGVKPVIVCGGIPDCLAEGPIRRNEGGQAVNRPKDYGRYREMLVQMFRRLAKTYGAEEVRTWFFEVWSHPDHEGSWEGGRSAPFAGEVTARDAAPFLRLYDQFAAAAVSVDPKLRIGGPGLAGDLSFFRRFLEHCARGSQPRPRLDFVSWSAWGTVPELVRRNEELRGIVEREFPELKPAAFLVTESAGSAAERARADTPYEAARLAALLDANARSQRGVDLIFRSGDLVADHFDGKRSLITRIGDNTVALPAFRLSMLLAKMGTERLQTETPAGFGAVAARQATQAGRNAAQALVYRYDPSLPEGSGEPEAVQVRFAKLPSSLLRLPVRVYRLDPETCAPLAEWTAAGKPVPAPAELGRKLAADPFKPTEENVGLFINSGEAIVELKLPPNSAALITLGAEPLFGAEVCSRGKRILRAEEEYAAAAELAQSGAHSRALDALRKAADRYPDTYWRQISLLSILSILETALRSPQQADGVRKELLELPLDDFERSRLLRSLRADAVRRNRQSEVDELNRRLAAIEQRLAAQRRWHVSRYDPSGQQSAVGGQPAPLSL
jgi:hypothetical protein